MNVRRKIRVLIVDDSLVFRETLARGLSADPGIEVVGAASDAYTARDMIIEHEPDVMTLDIEMPKMNGIEFLRRLIPQYPIPVVAVSAISEKVFEALKAGAVDFVVKADARGGAERLINELVVKIKIASVAKVGNRKKGPDQQRLTENIGTKASGWIIAIGASTGGTEAIAAILKAFPRDMPGIVVTQHMPPVFTKMYAARLNDSCLMEVKEAENGDLVLPGRVLVAPGDYQMRIKRANGKYAVECFKGEKVNGHCPSVDVLFDSVAEQAGRRAIGVILTGMGCDGAKGLLHMREKGARTIGQDEESCVVYGMPKAACDIGGVEKQVPLNRIAQTIHEMIRDEG